MEVLKNTFSKLIQTPLIGDEERKSLTDSFNSLTNEDAMLKMCKQIEYNYCTDEFLESIKASNNKIEFTRITNDVNGNPRYVVHFLELLNDSDTGSIQNQYEIAVKKANKIGGRKYNTKNYGGGIVFQSYNLKNLEEKINEIK